MVAKSASTTLQAAASISAGSNWSGQRNSASAPTSPASSAWPLQTAGSPAARGLRAQTRRQQHPDFATTRLTSLIRQQEGR